MDKLIFNKPICNTHECCNNNPEYPSHCEIWSSVEGCALAEIQRPNRLQRAITWIDRHWLRIAVVCLTASVFIIWSLYSMGLGATAAIDDLRAEYNQTCMRHK
jgi:hypothetical protein